MATTAEMTARLRGLIDKLETAMASGMKSIYSDGERIEYQSIADMLKARNEFARQLSVIMDDRRSRFRSYRYFPTMRL